MKPPAGVVQSVGTGPDLVLIHGTAADTSSWSALTRRLRTRIRATTYDRRGSGRWPIDENAPPPSTADHADDAADIIRDLGGGPVYVCGVSFGGVIALELIRRRSDLVRGAAVFEPPIAPNDHAASAPADLFRRFDDLVRQGRGPQAAEEFHRRVLSERGWELLPADAKAEARRLWREIHHDLSAGAAYRPPYDELSRIDVPVLLLRGGRSRPVFERSLRALAAALPHSKRVLLPHAGHRLFGQAWQELDDALTSFMGLPEA